MDTHLSVMLLICAWVIHKAMIWLHLFQLFRESNNNCKVSGLYLCLISNLLYSNLLQTLNIAFLWHIQSTKWQDSLWATVTDRRWQKIHNGYVRLLSIYWGCETITHNYIYFMLLYLHIRMHVEGLNGEAVKNRSTFRKPSRAILQRKKWLRSPLFKWKYRKQHVV